MKKYSMLFSLVLLLNFSVTATTAAAQTLTLTPREAVRRALNHNLGLKSERLAPELTSAPREIAESPFDTVFFAELNHRGGANPLFALNSGNGSASEASATEGSLGWSAGLLFEIPLGNRAAKARQTIARLKERRAALEIVMAFSIAAATGVFFGLYPARKASLLDPIEALRYE